MRPSTIGDQKLNFVIAPSSAASQAEPEFARHQGLEQRRQALSIGTGPGLWALCYLLPSYYRLRTCESRPAIVVSGGIFGRVRTCATV